MMIISGGILKARCAFFRFEENGSIEVYGISAEFGACDKQTTADLISQLFPGRKIVIGS